MKLLTIIMTFAILFPRDLEVQFISEDMWLMGVPVAGGETFDNGIMYGMGLYGTSSVDPFDAVNVDVRLSSHSDSASAAYVFSASNFDSNTSAANSDLFLLYYTLPAIIMSTKENFSIGNNTAR